MVFSFHHLRVLLSFGKNTAHFNYKTYTFTKITSLKNNSIIYGIPSSSPTKQAWIYHNFLGPSFSTYGQWSTFAFNKTSQRSFGTSRKNRKRLRVHPTLYRGYKKARKHAILGVQFPQSKEQLETVGLERMSQNDLQSSSANVSNQQRPHHLFSVNYKTLFNQVNENSVSMDKRLQKNINDTRTDNTIERWNDNNPLSIKTTTPKEKSDKLEKQKQEFQTEDTLCEKAEDGNSLSLSNAADVLFKELAELQTFRQFKLRSEVQMMILKSGMTTPTELQRIVIPKLLTGQSSLVVGPTGSGKTAAYLFPLISRLYDSDPEKLAPYSSCPRLIILTPTQELVDQTVKAVRKLVSRSTGLRLGSSSLRYRAGELHLGQDVVVATPQRLLSHFSLGHIRLNKVQSLVVDEADIMCVPPLGQDTLDVLKLIKIRNSREMGKMKPIKDLQQILKNVGNDILGCQDIILNKNMKSEFQKIIDQETVDTEHKSTDDVTEPWTPPATLKNNDEQHNENNSTNKLSQSHRRFENEDNHNNHEDIESIKTPSNTNMSVWNTEFPQVIFVTAVKTSALTEFINKYLSGSLKPIISAGAHLMPPQLQQVFIPIKDKTRMHRLYEILEETKAGKIEKEEEMSISNCPNTLGNATQTIIFTNRVSTCEYVARQLKESGYNAVALHGDLNKTTRFNSYKSFLAKKAKILVATNLASRGLDISSVGNIVMFQCPKTTADYLHRSGRASRAGHPGRVSTIYSLQDLKVIKEIQLATRSGRRLDIRDAGKTLKKALLARRNWQLEVAAKTKFPTKRALGAVKPKHRRRASRQAKWVMKQEYFRAKMLLEQKRLSRKGVIPKHGPFPTLPDPQIERSESKTYLRMIRGSDGLLQALPMKMTEFKDQRRRLEGQTKNYSRPLQGSERPSIPPREAKTLMKKVKRQRQSSEF